MESSDEEIIEEINLIHRNTMAGSLKNDGVDVSDDKFLIDTASEHRH